MEIRLEGKFLDVNALQRKLNTAVGEYAEKAVIALCEHGAKVAESNMGNFTGNASFSVGDVKRSNGVYEASMIGKGDTIHREWEVAGGGTHFEDINALLMAEFGSGFLADTSKFPNVRGVGQGTLNKYHHAFDEKGWFYTDDNGVLHHSYGTAPTHPMHKADMAMMRDAERVLKGIK